MNYFIASMLCAFAVGVIVGVMIEAKARGHYVKKDRDDDGW